MVQLIGSIVHAPDRYLEVDMVDRLEFVEIFGEAARLHAIIGQTLVPAR